MAKKKTKYGTHKTIQEKERILQRDYFAAGIFLSVLTIYFSLTCSAYLNLHPRANLFDALSESFSVITKNPFYFIKSITAQGITTAFGLSFFVILIVYFALTTEKLKIHHDLNVLKGSSEWADLNDLAERFAEKDEKDDYRNAHYNAIMSHNFFMSIDMKKHFHALNTLVIGTTGSGKSRFFLKPNMLQMNCNYVITDPSGGLLQSCGEALRRFGYNVRVFDLTNMTNCNTYNPMKYCYKEADVKKLVQTFIKNVAELEGGSSQDPFWDNAMNALFCACVSLLVNYGNNPEIMGGKIYTPCFSNLCELVRMANRKSASATQADVQNNTASGSELNMIFERIRKSLKEGQKKPYCLREWENFKIAPEKTSTTVLMTAAVKMDAFNIQEIENLTSSDTINLDEFGLGRDALFVIIPTNDSTYNFLPAFMYTQLFDLLYKHGEYDSLGSIDLKLPNGELVKHFTKEEVKQGISDRIADIKNATISRVEVTGVHKIPSSKKDKALDHVLDDSYYEILDAKGNLVIRRPTEALAKQYIKDLQNAKEIKGNGESLPCHTRFLLDEFPNTGRIPEFLEKLSTVRKYEISCTIFCQSITQLKGMYENNYEVVDANCPQTIFLGGDENTNNEYISKKLGSTTVKGQSASVDSKHISGSYQTDTRELMKPEELGRIPFGDEIIMIYGEQPVYDQKFDYPTHKNYRYTYDYAHSLGIDAYKFDRSAYQRVSEVAIILEVEMPSFKPTVKPFNADAFCSIIGIGNKDEAFEAFEESPQWNFATVTT